MKTNEQPGDSWFLLTADLLSANVLVWCARVRYDRSQTDLTPDAHHYFFDRYQRLADYHRARGRVARAKRLQEKADEHYRAGGSGGPPHAAAMAMPRPGRFIQTNAVSGRRSGGFDDAA